MTELEFVDLDAQAITLIQLYGLTFVRCATFVFCVPPFFGRPLPIRMRLVFAALLAIFASNASTAEIAIRVELLTLILQEFVVGFALGFAASSVLTAFQMAGSLIGRLAGGSLISSSASDKDSPTTAFYYGTAATLLFATGGHRTVVNALLMSFQSFPAGTQWTLPNSFDFLCEVLTTSFEFALRVAMPVALTLLAASIVTALAARFVRSFSFFGIGMSFNASLLVTAMLLACGLMPILFELHFESAFELATAFLQSIQV
ncbi:MAG: flagellar biosynthetic protein FliR [Planctomycetales bacterium]|nr:flagellar biosynthetic protein FliR [Planctomycetales bacterium]